MFIRYFIHMVAAKDYIHYQDELNVKRLAARLVIYIIIFVIVKSF